MLLLYIFCFDGHHLTDRNIPMETGSNNLNKLPFIIKRKPFHRFIPINVENLLTIICVGNGIKKVLPKKRKIYQQISHARGALKHNIRLSADRWVARSCCGENKASSQAGKRVGY